MATNDEEQVICQGCENECEVSIAFREGKAICLGGNKCPTGETFALAQVAMKMREKQPFCNGSATLQNGDHPRE